MEFIDLQTVTDALRTDDRPNYVIDRVTIYGQIGKEMPRPMNIANNVRTEKGGKFAEFKLFGVNLSTHARILEDVFKITSNDYIYMVNGSLLVYVPEELVNTSTFVEITGKIAQGKACNDYFSLLSWGKDINGWFIRPSKVSKSMLIGWDENTEHYMYATKSIQNNKIILPEDIKDRAEIFAYESNRRFKEKETTTVEESTDLEMPEFTTAKVVFNKENRSEIKNFSDTAKMLQAILDKAKEQKSRFINALRKDYVYEESCNDYLKMMLDNIVKYLKRKPNVAAMTGKAIVKKYLESAFYKESEQMYLGTKLSNFMSDDFEEIAEFVKDNNSLLTFNDEAWDLCKNAFTDRESLYAGLLAVCIGKDVSEFVSIAKRLKNIEISFSKVVNINPYVLAIMTNLNFNQVEYIALCMGKAKDMSLELYRDIALLHDFTTNTNVGSTVFTTSQIKYATQIGVKLTKNQFERCLHYHTYLSDTIGNNIVYYVNNQINPFYDVNQFRSYGAYYYKSMSYDLKDLAIDNYIKSGLGVKFNDYITDYSLLEKELYVYNFMYEMASRETGYKLEDIDKYIDEFEEQKGFVLELKQREAVELLVNSGACIAGGAGSGKTTTSDCFVYVLNRLNPTKVIKFGAPTGKAAKRMQEVLHREVPTLHREFKIGLNNDETAFDVEDNTTVDSENVVYLFDESAMISLTLMYQITKRLDANTASIYMFGDFNQLPPIGKGFPFRNLLRFMPCVFLEVSKRAKDGSTITLNADYVNECSDKENWKYLEDKEDFRLVPCASENLQKIVAGICKHYLGKSTKYEDNTTLSFMHMREFPEIANLSADDIQVVSPIGKASYSWGTGQLNHLLQPIFNTNGGYSNTFCYYYSENNYQKFIIGDRIIHTDSNNYGMQWYCSFKDGELHKTYGYGISNGEVGKIVGFIPANTARIYSEDEDKPEDFQYPSNMRKDETFIRETTNGYFVVVQYTDYLTDKNFYILYRAELSAVNNNIGIALKGEDLGHLSLFYAGTTHKLQGSQAKLIISVLDKNEMLRTFLSRNMIYTIMTRAIDFEFCIGSVANTPDSMLSKARTVQAESGINTIGELLYE